MEYTKLYHQKDIDDEWSDDQIWQHAKENNLIIITKDKDFSIKQLINGAPPKIIHIRFGNVNMKTFFKILTSCWSDVEFLIRNNNLVNIYHHTLEAIK